LLCVVIGGPGYKFHFWELGSAFQIFGIAPVVAIVALILVVVTISLKKAKQRSVLPLIASAIGALAALYFPLSMKLTADSLPYIHDVTTDTENPPLFVDLIEIRNADPRTKNPAQYPGKEVARQQLEGYPDLQPLLLDQSREKVFDKARATIDTMGWELVSSVPGQGRLEATDATFWFGFKDDVVIRIQTKDGKTLVDVRSKSRVGESDLGANAKRIENYLNHFAGS
jgi:uncharacterized protein (DUF1499 family)